MVKSAERMPASVPSEVVDVGDVEAAPFAPPAVHPQEHLGPVLCVDPAVLGVDPTDGVGLVVLTGEQAAQLELGELGLQGDDAGLGLGLVALVALLAGQLVEDLDVVHLRRQRVIGVEVVLDGRVLAGEAFGAVLIVPEVGCGDRHLQLSQAGPTGVDPQVAMGLDHPVPERAVGHR